MFSNARALRFFVLALAAVLSPLAASAAESSSANFRNTRSDVNVGGRRKTSASFREDGTVGSPAKTAETSASYYARAGIETERHYPSRVTDLFASSTALTTQIYLQWTTPGNDGGEDSTPGKYVVRYTSVAAESPAISDAKFDAATDVSGVPAATARGTRLTMNVNGLSSGVTYYFALKTAERDGTRSPLSAGATAQTLAVNGCVVVRNVNKTDGPYTTIQAAVNALPSSLAGHSCVIVKDLSTYAEQVTVQGFTMNGSSISIFTDPALSGRAVVAPNLTTSTGAFVIANASVNVMGFDIRPSASVQYGVYATGAYVRVSTVNVDAPTGLVWGAGVAVSSWSTVAGASVTVTAANGFYLAGSTMTTIANSTAVVNGASANALLLSGASSDTVTASVFRNAAGHAVQLSGGAFNAISLSTMVTTAATYDGLFLAGSSSNSVTGSYVQSLSGNAVHLTAGSDYNTLSAVTGVSAVASPYMALHCIGSDRNVVTGSTFRNSAGFAGNIQAGCDFNAISFSTFSSNGAGQAALRFFSADSNTVTGSYIENTAAVGLALVSGADGNVISLSTITSTGGDALSFDGSDTNTVTGSMIYTTGAGNAVFLNNFSDYNAINASTLTAVSGNAFYAIGSGVGDTVTGSYLRSDTGAALQLNGTVGGGVSQSTMSSGGTWGVLIQNTSGHTIAGSFIRSTANGQALRYDSHADSNTVTLSTVVAGGSNVALYVNNSASITFVSSYFEAPSNVAMDLNSYSTGTVVYRSTAVASIYGVSMVSVSSTSIIGSVVRGQTAALYIGNSTGTSVAGSNLSATGGGGNGILMTGGSVNLTLATSTVAGSSAGAGLLLNPGLNGRISVASATFSGSAKGISISTGAAGFMLAIDSVNFSGLTPGATAIHFLGGSFVSTITAASFSDAALGANVSGAALDPLTARITMRGAAGQLMGPGFENDPNSLVDWPDLLPPSAVSLYWVGLSSAALNYGAVAGAAGYTVQASTRADFQSGTAVSSTVFGTQGTLAVTPLMPNSTYYLRAGALWGGSTVYAQTVLSTSTLANLVTGTTVYQIHLTSMVVNWVPLSLAPPDASSKTAEGYVLQASSEPTFSPMWASSATANVALSTLTIDTLRGGVTYYFRVGSYNHNGVPNFASAL
jgi:hypothetical protein